MSSSWFSKDGTPKRNVIRRYAKPKTKLLAKKLRLRMTPTEKAVWIRLHALNMRFRRQAIILGWIADFYHPQSKLVIEIDGGYHQTEHQRRKDAARDRVMLRRGLRILRIPASHVESNLDSVVDFIVSSTESRPPTQPKGSLVGVGSSGRPAVSNESRSGSPTVPSAKPMHGRKREGSGEAASAHPLNRQGSEYPGQAGA